MESICNANCSCVADELSPVCDSHGTSYFSACFAGCHSKTPNGVRIFVANVI